MNADSMGDMNEKVDKAAWIKAGAATCASEPRHVDRPWRLALLGAPGVGKGTQAELLSHQLGACHLSTGDVFRAAKNLAPNELTPALSSALEYMRRGELVPDVTVLAMISERLGCLHCGGGFLLDGFPRTVIQAAALDVLLRREEVSLDAVVNYEMDLDQIVARLAGRRSCPKCKAIFHVISHRPRVEGICDHCASALCQREDDRPEAVRVRMEVYRASAGPLVEYYRQRNLLISIEATGTAEAICGRTIEILKTRRGQAEMTRDTRRLASRIPA
jgi:adenylate kinase